MTDETCGRCHRTFHEHLGMVSPIDDKGRSTGNVLLCRVCMELWHKVYYSAGNKIGSIEFFIKWDKQWRKFMRGEAIIKERIDFT